jgi:hypothetical protein
MLSEYPANTKTANNKAQLFGHLIAHSAIEREKSMDKRVNNPQITNFVHNLPAADSQNSK